jgi:hypothetical protein
MGLPCRSDKAELLVHLIVWMHVECPLMFAIVKKPPNAG